MNLKHYSTLAAAFIAMKSKSDAQIVYTDIEDTTVVGNGSYSLDLNNDGIRDFVISDNFKSYGYRTDFSETASIRIIPTRLLQYPSNYNNEIGTSYGAKALSAGYSINARSPWIASRLFMEGYYFGFNCSCSACDSNCGFQKHYGSGGNWLNKKDHFLGLRITRKADTLYGWARLDVSVAAPYCKFVIKDYAIDTVPGESIRAGQVNCNLMTPSFLKADIVSCNPCLTLKVSDPFGYVVNWYKNDTLIADATQSSLKACSSGSYSVKWSLDSLSCYSDTINVTFLPKPTISQIGDTLISSSKDSNQWLLNSQPIVGATDQIYVPNQLGKFSVEVKLSDTCELISDPVIISGISAINNPEKISITVLPHKTVQVRFSNEDFLHGKIKILNASGQEIKQLTIDKSILQIPFSVNETGWFIVDIEKDEHHFDSPVLIF